jgi:hypothetical protein
LNPRLLALGALAVFAIATGTTSLAQTTPAPAAPPTPPAPATPINSPTQAPLLTVPGTTPTPTATDLTAPTPVPSLTPVPTRKGRGGLKAKPSPSPDASETPEPAQFSNLDGVWEIEGQPFGQRNAVYSHLNLVQKDQVLSGTWKRDDKHTLPVTGTFDGRVFHLTATDSNTKTVYTLQGYVENFSDMVGRVSADSTTFTPLNFTGQHRKKSKISA